MCFCKLEQLYGSSCCPSKEVKSKGKVRRRSKSIPIDHKAVFIILMVQLMVQLILTWDFSSGKIYIINTLVFIPRSSNLGGAS
jgi:hypothetical protein